MVDESQLLHRATGMKEEQFPHAPRAIPRIPCKSNAVAPVYDNWGTGPRALLVFWGCSRSVLNQVAPGTSAAFLSTFCRAPKPLALWIGHCEPGALTTLQPSPLESAAAHLIHRPFCTNGAKFT